METYPVATIDPAIENGMACFTGTCIPIATLFGNLAAGMTIDQIVSVYPGLTRESMCRALDEACKLLERDAARPTGPEEEIDPRSGYGQAIRRGDELKAQLCRSKEFISPVKAAALLGISVQALHEQVDDGRVIALSISKKGPRRFPAWQFDKQHIEMISKVIAALPDYDSSGKYLVFTRVEPVLDGKTLLEEIQRGNGEEVLKVAKMLNDEL